MIVDAGVRDETGTLGAAVLVGPACKEERFSDWDVPGGSLSLNSFLINDGFEEYLQFDGQHNTGLLVGFVNDLWFSFLFVLASYVWQHCEELVPHVWCH